MVAANCPGVTGPVAKIGWRKGYRSDLAIYPPRKTTRALCTILPAHSTKNTTASSH